MALQEYLPPIKPRVPKPKKPNYRDILIIETTQNKWREFILFFVIWFVFGFIVFMQVYTRTENTRQLENSMESYIMTWEFGDPDSYLKTGSDCDGIPSLSTNGNVICK